MKKFLYITGLFLTGTLFAQPIITSIDKTSGTANELITISGTGFSSPSVIYFGNGKTTPESGSTSTLIQVKVPATATYGPVIVVNADGKIATSSQYFTMSFDNDSKLATFSTRDAIVSQAVSDIQPYDLCLCDFNNDGLLDAAMSSLGSDNIQIARAGGTPASPTMTLGSIQSTPVIANKTANITCGDLNNDGLPDLVTTSLVAGEPFVHVFQNAASFNFTKITPLSLPLHDGSNRQGKKVRIGDVDGDGKPDLVVGSQKAGDNNVLIYLNTSNATVSFNTTPILITVPNAANSGAFDLADFDNDGKLDLALVPFRQVDVVYLLKNTSLPGSVSFSLESTVGGNSERANIEVGDFDNDGLNDLAVVRSNGLEIFKNNGGFSFSALSLPSLLLSGVTAWGLDLGDMDGDGLVDVVVGSIEGDQIIYYRNTTSGSIGFSVDAVITTAGPARNLRIGDLNQDGKPDIAIADDSQSGFPGSFSYIINRNSMTPLISPTSGTFCTGASFILTTTGGEGVNYTWNVSGETPINNGTNMLDMSGFTGNKTVTVRAESPDLLQNIISVVPTSFTHDASNLPANTPSFTNATFFCAGDDFTLTTSASATNYHWYGPDGLLISNNSNSFQVDASAKFSQSGIYTLIVDNGNCYSEPVTTTVTISGPPTTSVEVLGCNDGAITLEVPDYTSLFSYQWKVDGGNVSSGGNSFSYIVNSDLDAGSYTLELDDGMCTFTSTPIIIPNPPTSNFSGPSFGATNEVCLGVQTDFTTTSTNGTGAEALTLGYSWEIEEPSPSTTIVATGSSNSLSHTFASVGAWKVRLLTEYTDGIGCNVLEKTITVSADPAYTLSQSTVTKCFSDQTTISLTGASVGNGDTWTWDDIDATTDADLVTDVAGTYTATYTTNTGCETTTGSVVITDFDGIGVTATESTFKVSELAQTTVRRDTIIFAEDQTSVTLTAANSMTFTWTSAKPNGDPTTSSDIDNPAVATVVVKPSAPTIIVTVSGQTLDGCTESTEIVITSGSFTPRKSFSPNGDGINDLWTINNSRNLDGCTVYIIDGRGATVLEATSPFIDDIVWDGNYNGNPAPDGVYYFVMKCADSEESQTGSILLAR